MRLYSLAEATGVDHDGVHYGPQDDGGFDFPGPLAGKLHASHVAGQPQWETAIERQQRMIREELVRRQSPEALYEAVSKLVMAAERTVPAAAEPDVEPEPAAPKTPRRTPKTPVKAE